MKKENEREKRETALVKEPQHGDTVVWRGLAGRIASEVKLWRASLVRQIMMARIGKKRDSNNA